MIETIDEIISVALRLPVYKLLWKRARAFNSLPLLEPHWLATHIDERREAMRNGIWFTVERRGAMVHFCRAIDDFALDTNISIGPRPLVFFKTAQACLIWSLYAYAHGGVPLIREKSVPLTKKMAYQYDVTDILTDCDGYDTLAQEDMVTNVRIVVFDARRTPITRPRSPVFVQLFALEETGTLGVVSENSTIRYFPDVHVETNDVWSVSLLRKYAEPLIRYSPGV